MRTTFFQQYHLPLLVTLLAIAWMMIGLRARVFFKNNYKDRSSWTTLLGSALVFSAFAGVLVTVYVILQIVTFVMNQRLFQIFDSLDQSQDMRRRDDSDFASALSDSQCRYILRLVTIMIQMAIGCRFLLTFALWAVKFSLLAVYLKSDAKKLHRVNRWALRAAAPILLITLLLAVIIIMQGYTSIAGTPTADDVRNITQVAQEVAQGVTFLEIGDEEELALTLLNFLTDVLLTVVGCFVACKATMYGSLKSRPSLASVWLLLVMGGTTVAIAFVRIIFVAVSLGCTDNCEDLSTLMTPIMVFGELEAFTALLVSCLPGLRALLRAIDKQAVVAEGREAWQTLNG